MEGIVVPRQTLSQLDLLYLAMRTAHIIRGWSLSELVELVRMPELGFGYCQTAETKYIKPFLLSKLKPGKGDVLFQRLGSGREVKYRALPRGRTKTPCCSDDWEKLVGCLVEELNTTDHETLVRAARRYGHLFGFDVSMMPESLLQNQIMWAMFR